MHHSVDLAELAAPTVFVSTISIDIAENEPLEVRVRSFSISLSISLSISFSISVQSLFHLLSNQRGSSPVLLGVGRVQKNKNAVQAQRVAGRGGKALRGPPPDRRHRSAELRRTRTGVARSLLKGVGASSA